MEGIHRVISSNEAADILIKQLAFENANSTCQAILCPVKKYGTLSDFIKQCEDVGPAMMQGVAIAAAIKGDSYQQAVQSFLTGRNSNNQVQNAGSSRAYFSCGQEGHFTCACPQRTANSSQPNPATTAMIPSLPKSLCPRCQKGYHWAKDCRSRFHKNGTSLVPDQQSGNGLRGQLQALIMIGAMTTTMNPFIPFVITELIRATPGSAGLDLSSTTSTILTPDSPTIKIPTGGGAKMAEE